MYFSKAAILGFLVCLIQGAPTSFLDVPTTAVKLSSDLTNPQHFIVSVERTDLLIDGSGETQAERIMSVKLDFNVKDDMLMLNGQDACNIDQPEPKITTIKATFVRGDVSNPEELVSMFSEGLVSIQVSSKAQNFIVDGAVGEDGLPVIGRRLTITENILEIDGTQVRQSEVSEQVFDLYLNGTLVRAVSDPTLDEQATLIFEEVPCDSKDDLLSIEDSSMDSDIDPVTNYLDLAQFETSWEQLQPEAQSTIICVLFSFLISIFVLASAFIIRRKRQAAQYSLLSNEDSPPSYGGKDATLFQSEAKIVSESFNVSSI